MEPKNDGSVNDQLTIKKTNLTIKFKLITQKVNFDRKESLYQKDIRLVYLKAKRLQKRTGDLQIWIQKTHVQFPNY